MSTDNKKISELYHSTDMVEPPAQLDETILEASRNAIKRKTKTTGPFTGGWPALASVAALVVITIVIVPIVMHETPDNELVSDYATDMIGEQENILAPKRKLREQGITYNEQPSIIESESRTLSSLEKHNPPASVAAPQPLSDAETQALEQQGTTSASVADHYGFGSLADNKTPATPALNAQLKKQSIPQKQVLSQTKTENTQLPARAAAVEEKKLAANELRSGDLTTKSGITHHAPDEWLTIIIKLLDNNEPEKAQKEFDNFKKSYPDYNVDKKLLSRLKQYSLNDSR